jgi:alkylation response protein AidB-like acyl-CoA dehydrogenase
MYDLQLTPEQLEFRDTVRDFVDREVKPVATHPTRLEPFEKPLLLGLLDQASQMGLRSLGLPEEAGGSGTDLLTTCMLLEELAAGDVDLAVVLGETALLAGAVHQAMNAAQRDRWLPRFERDDRFHLALISRRADAERGWSYLQPISEDAVPAGAPQITAERNGAGDWVVNGFAPFVSNAPVAGLFVVQAAVAGSSTTITMLIGRDTKGLSVAESVPAFGDEGRMARWHHGAVARVTLTDCVVSAADVLPQEAAERTLHAELPGRHSVQMTAINIGVARAAYESAIEYAKMRWQGGRWIVEHQAIGLKLADVAVQLEAARSLAWKAAWLADHPGAIADRSVSDLPWPIVARTFAADALHRATLEAAECFGAMGVMRDMPLQKYVHDTLVLRHSLDCDLASPLVVAEAVAGFVRQ